MLALKNSQKREELGSTLMTHPFFPFINDNLNQTTSKNQASWHNAINSSITFYSDIQDICYKVNAKVSSRVKFTTPCQLG